MYVCIYAYRFQNVFLRCPTPRLHCFLSSHWPSFRFLSCMAFFIPFIQFFFGLPRALCFGIHFNDILGNRPSAILWTWPSFVRCWNVYNSSHKIQRGHYGLRSADTFLVYDSKFLQYVRSHAHKHTSRLDLLGAKGCRSGDVYWCVLCRKALHTKLN